MCGYSSDEACGRRRDAAGARDRLGQDRQAHGRDVERRPSSMVVTNYRKDGTIIQQLRARLRARGRLGVTSRASSACSSVSTIRTRSPVRTGRSTPPTPRGSTAAFGRPSAAPPQRPQDGETAAAADAAEGAASAGALSFWDRTSPALVRKPGSARCPSPFRRVLGGLRPAGRLIAVPGRPAPTKFATNRFSFTFMRARETGLVRDFSRSRPRFPHRLGAHGAQPLDMQAADAGKGPSPFAPEHPLAVVSDDILSRGFIVGSRRYQRPTPLPRARRARGGIRACPPGSRRRAARVAHGAQRGFDGRLG